MKFKYDIALSFATENQEFVNKVYHYLRQEGMNVFFAPAPECQIILSGQNQREIFFNIFGNQSRYVALFVSKDYVIKDVPMEEAGIAFAKHSLNGTVVPIYLDGTKLPESLLDPKQINYFVSNSAPTIAVHLAEKIKVAKESDQGEKLNKRKVDRRGGNVFNVIGNVGKNQIFIQEMKGNINQ